MIAGKEVDIVSYLDLAEEKAAAEKEMMNNSAIVKLKETLTEIKGEIKFREFGYRANIQNCESAMQSIKEKVIKEWDIVGKTFKCDRGGIMVRTTRSIKVDNKERLISILQQIGKLTRCIKGWDLTYLRELADAGLFDVDAGETKIVHYDEKMNVVISAAKNGGKCKNEE